MLMINAAALGSGTRADHTARRTPDPARNGTAVQSLATTWVRLVATASAGLTAAANLLDRRRVHGLLRPAGAALKVLDKARLRETVLPLVVGALAMVAALSAGRPLPRGVPSDPARAAD